MNEPYASETLHQVDVQLSPGVLSVTRLEKEVVEQKPLGFLLFKLSLLLWTKLEYTPPSHFNKIRDVTEY